jgi:hypothetical protein
LLRRSAERFDSFRIENERIARPAKAGSPAQNASVFKAPC